MPESPDARIIGVDVARAAALLGMMAGHVFDGLDDEGARTASTLITVGRSAATFALVAGASVALTPGGRPAARGRERSAVSGGLVVRALLIGVIGLALGSLGERNGIDGILPFYAVLFLLAVPLLGRPRRLEGRLVRSPTPAGG
jgi:uncharacterized membrane protein